MEAGLAVELSHGDTRALYLEPQVQVIYTDYRGGGHVEHNGTVVAADEAGGLTTRVGARLYTRAHDIENNRVQPFVEANWWHGGEHNSATFSGTKLTQDRAANVYEVKGGAQVELGGGWTGWGELSLEAADGDQRTVSGLIGIKHSW